MDFYRAHTEQRAHEGPFATMCATGKKSIFLLWRKRLLPFSSFLRAYVP